MAHLTALSQQRAVAARAGRPARPRLPAPGVAAALRPRGGARAPRAAETAAAAGTTSGGGPSGGPDGGGGGPVYQGVYGPWRVEREDEVEVLWCAVGGGGAARAGAGGREEGARELEAGGPARPRAHPPRRATAAPPQLPPRPDRDRGRAVRRRGPRAVGCRARRARRAMRAGRGGAGRERVPHPRVRDAAQALPAGAAAQLFPWGRPLLRAHAA